MDSAELEALAAQYEGAAPIVSTPRRSIEMRTIAQALRLLKLVREYTGQAPDAMIVETCRDLLRESERKHE